MQVRKLTAYILRVPLRKPFRHASAVRHYSDNIVVEAELADGTTGWGEGVPREYVTGETAEGALAQLVETPVQEQLSGEATNWQEVFARMWTFHPRTGRRRSTWLPREFAPFGGRTQPTGRLRKAIRAPRLDGDQGVPPHRLRRVRTSWRSPDRM